MLGNPLVPVLPRVVLVGRPSGRTADGAVRLDLQSLDRRGALAGFGPDRDRVVGRLIRTPSPRPLATESGGIP